MMNQAMRTRPSIASVKEGISLLDTKFVLQGICRCEVRNGSAGWEWLSWLKLMDGR